MDERGPRYLGLEQVSPALDAALQGFWRASSRHLGGPEAGKHKKRGKDERFMNYKRSKKPNCALKNIVLLSGRPYVGF